MSRRPSDSGRSTRSRAASGSRSSSESRKRPGSLSDAEPRKRSAGGGGKFMPNLSQLRQASKSLPDPETWPEDSYEYALEVDDARQTIAFKRLKLKRSSGTSFRWIYEGKVLFRNRDIGTKE